ncbi:Ig-like V-type domain-containing protein FAM187A [Lampris incognitus]|uniref:Ig-like V-type domain-containing protein FAM187A n=1 Tax=Lampris incognitus TaxID=2546036 RepID=UPI0024B5029A|nr:Ig-like V-type domain-containing protein FAM187A [Lampris incognitus]
MAPLPRFPSLARLVLFPLLLSLLGRSGWSYEAPEDEEDVFAKRACPAFLSFTNAAYLAGVTVELPCHCKPTQIHSVVWFYKKHLDNAEGTRALTDLRGNKLLDTSLIPHSGDLRSRFSIRLFSLLIFRAGPEDSGLYFCGSTHRDFFFAYDLDIQKVHKLSLYSSSTQEKERLRDAQRVAGLDSSRPLYQTFTSYQKWLQCDRCGMPGEQVRAGLCYVHSRYLHVRYRRASQTAASCGSGAVPRSFGLSQRRVGATMEVRMCLQTCPPQAPPSPKLLSLMAFLGHSSPSQSVEMPLFYLSHPAEQVLTLGCPGSRPYLAVAWDKESKPIYRSEHLDAHNPSATSSRLFIDTRHHLVFTPAKTEDSGVYYCWLQGRKAAKIHLLVYTRFGRGRSLTSHPDFKPAVKMVLTSYAAMTAVFILLVTGRAGVRILRNA